jgi:GNAT superfamily N-acetyltransferase
VSLAVRQARADELPRTVDIRLAMIREIDGFDLDERRPGWRERYTDFYGDGMAAGTAAVLLAEDDGAFAGMACVYVLRNHRSEIFSEPSAIVSNVYVPPERRRQGIATALMRAAVGWARERGCVVVRLRSSEGGQPLYEALGFSRTAEFELRLT